MIRFDWRRYKRMFMPAYLKLGGVPVVVDQVRARRRLLSFAGN